MRAMNKPSVLRSLRAIHVLGLFALAGAAAAATPTYTFTTVAGAVGQPGSADGTGSEARFNYPVRLAVDGAGNLYVADYFNHTIRRITSAGVVTTLAGLPGVPGATDGTGSDARLHYPGDIALDLDGNLYVPEFPNHTIRKITSAGVVTTFAGLAGVPGSADGTGSAARFNQPFGVAADGAGNVYVADSTNSTIRRITSAGVVTTIAGLAGAIGSVDGIGADARFYYPTGVAVDGAGVVSVADRANHVIRRIGTGGVVSTLAGMAGLSGATDGTGAAARFQDPYGIAADTGGTVYIADTYNSTLRRITLGGAVATVGGLAGNSGFADGAGADARFGLPHGIAVDRDYNIYIADYTNHTIRKGVPNPGRPAITSATTAGAVFGGAFQYVITASNSPTDFDALNLPVGLSVDHATGVISGVPAQTGQFLVSIAASNITGGGTADLVLTVAKASATVTLGATTQVGDGTPKEVTVSTSPEGLGTTVTYDGVSTPPTLVGTYAVVATVVDDNYQGSATGTLTITDAIPLEIVTQPANAAVILGETATFSVVARASQSISYQWYQRSVALPGATGATLVMPGVTEAEASDYRVVVSAGASTLTSKWARLDVLVPPAITQPPEDLVVKSGRNATFTVRATGTGALSYQWRKGGVNLPDENSSRLQLRSVTPASAGVYDVVVTNAAGSAVSTAATLTVQ